MTTVLWSHCIYLGVSLAVTVWVGRTLQKHGKIFATGGQRESNGLIDSFARLLEVGFYLLNFGAINVALRYGGAPTDPQSAFEIISTKLGVVLLILGGVHLLMTVAFNEVRKQHRRDHWNGAATEHSEPVFENRTYSR